MNKWWGYRHIDGNTQVKRYFDQRDIEEAETSDFVVITYGPFEAIDREDAFKKIDRIRGIK